MFKFISSFFLSSITFLVNYFLKITGSAPLSIILSVLIFSLLFSPITLYQTRATGALSKIQPEIDKIKSLSKSKEEEGQRIVELYNEVGVNPLTIILLLIARIIIIGYLFSSLRSISNIFEGSYIFGIHLNSPDKYYFFPILAVIFTNVTVLIQGGPSMSLKTSFILPLISFFFVKNLSVAMLFGVMTMSLYTIIETKLIKPLFYKD